MSLNVSDWFRQLAFPVFLSRHFDAHGESGLTSSARPDTEKKATKTAADARMCERDIDIVCDLEDDKLLGCRKPRASKIRSGQLDNQGCVS